MEHFLNLPNMSEEEAVNVLRDMGIEPLIVDAFALTEEEAFPIPPGFLQAIGEKSEERTETHRVVVTNHGEHIDEMNVCLACFKIPEFHKVLEWKLVDTITQIEFNHNPELSDNDTYVAYTQVDGEPKVTLLETKERHLAYEACAAEFRELQSPQRYRHGDPSIRLGVYVKDHNEPWGRRKQKPDSWTIHTVTHNTIEVTVLAVTIKHTGWIYVDVGETP